MKIKKTLSPAQIAQRRANAQAAKERPHKKFVSMRIDDQARELIRDYVADRENKCATMSDAIRARFG